MRGAQAHSEMVRIRPPVGCVETSRAVRGLGITSFVSGTRAHHRGPGAEAPRTPRPAIHSARITVTVHSNNLHSLHVAGGRCLSLRFDLVVPASVLILLKCFSAWHLEPSLPRCSRCRHVLAPALRLARRVCCWTHPLRALGQAPRGELGRERLRCHRPLSRFGSTLLSLRKACGERAGEAAGKS